MKAVGNYKGYRIDQIYGTSYSSMPAAFVIMTLKDSKDESSDPEVINQLPTEFTTLELAKNHIDKLMAREQLND